MSNHVILENEAQYRRTRLMQEAEHHRLVQEAVSGRERRAGYYERALNRFGQVLILAGQRMQAQDSTCVDCTSDAAFNY